MGSVEPLLCQGICGRWLWSVLLRGWYVRICGGVRRGALRLDCPKFASLLISNDDELVPFERPVLFWVPVSMESVEPLLCQRVCGCRPCAMLRSWSVVVWAVGLCG